MNLITHFIALLVMLIHFVAKVFLSISHKHTTCSATLKKNYNTLKNDTKLINNKVLVQNEAVEHLNVPQEAVNN